MNSPLVLEYDLVVFGGGPGGLSAAVLAGRTGLKVALVERTAVERMHELRAKRDGKRFERAMADFRAAAADFAGEDCVDGDGGGLMPAAIEAAQADATTGEMMAVLKEALGWDAPYNFAPH